MILILGFYLILTIDLTKGSLPLNGYSYKLIWFMMLTIFPLMIVVNVLTYGMNHGYGRYKLNWLGREILKYAPNEDEIKHTNLFQRITKKLRG